MYRISGKINKMTNLFPNSFLFSSCIAVIINITNLARNSHCSWPMTLRFLDVFGWKYFPLKMRITGMEIMVEFSQRCLVWTSWSHSVRTRVEMLLIYAS